MLDSLRPGDSWADRAQLDDRLSVGPLLDGRADDHPSTAPCHDDGTLIDRSLRPADDQEVVMQMAYVLRAWPGARGRRRADDALARMTAERLVDYLHLSGFELMKRPMVTDTGYIGADP